jgi:hypothetical protein
MLPEIAPEELAATLDRVAWEALEAAGCEGPPVDALEVARRDGLEVAYDSRQSIRARIVSLQAFGTAPPHDSILLRPDPRPERLHWAVAHEIGEHHAERVFSLLGIDPREADPSSREMVANHLAGRVLLPTEWFGRDALDCDWDIPELKRRYTTASHELVARRMLDFEPWITITIFDNGRLTFRRSNRYRRRPELTAAERHCWHEVVQSCEARSIEERPFRVACWPIHEPDWRREILRTSYDEVELDID